MEFILSFIGVSFDVISMANDGWKLGGTVCIVAGMLTTTSGKLQYDMILITISIKIFSEFLSFWYFESQCISFCRIRFNANIVRTFNFSDGKFCSNLLSWWKNFFILYVQKNYYRNMALFPCSFVATSFRMGKICARAFGSRVGTNLYVKIMVCIKIARRNIWKYISIESIPLDVHPIGIQRTKASVMFCGYWSEDLYFQHQSPLSLLLWLAFKYIG